MVRDSEYRRQFRSKWDNYAEEYDGNVQYRCTRRSVEHNHHADAFVWDEREWWESDSVASAGVRPRSGIPLHKYKHEKFNEAYRDRLAQYQREKRRKKEKRTEQNGDSSISTPDHEKQNRIVQDLKQLSLEKYSPTSISMEKPESRNAKVQVSGLTTPSSYQGVGVVHATPIVDHATQTNCKDVQKMLEEESGMSDEDNLLHDVQQNSSWTKPAATVSRPKKPIKKPSFTVLGPRQARPRSAPPPAQKLLQKPVHPPFLAYGYRDREREVGAKKTHNIRASAEVYPSALRAQRRMELVINQIEDDAKKASNFEKRRQALFNDRPKVENWDTEYRQNYVGYDGLEYGKILSARLHPLKHPRAYFIPA